MSEFTIIDNFIVETDSLTAANNNALSWWRKAIERREEIENLRDEIERLQTVISAQGETIKAHEDEIDGDKAEIEQYRKLVELIDPVINWKWDKEYFFSGERMVRARHLLAVLTKNSGPAPNPENHDIRAPMMGEGAGSLHSTKDSPEMTAGERDILHTALRGSVRKVTEKDNGNSG